MTGAFRIVHRNALVYRRVWRGSLFGSFLQPTLYLLAMGIGLGTLVDRGDPPMPGVPYLHFLAPGLLAAACMQTAAFESSFPVMGKMTWQRNYDAMTATPLRVRDVVIGELAWIALRLSMVAAAFTTVLILFDIPRSPLVALAVPAAVLTGLAFSAPILAYAATLKASDGFNVLFRFGVTPLFLFSGVFFPLSRLPEPLQWIAWVTPLYHGVELVRALTLNTGTPSIWIGHLAYLSIVTAVGAAVAVRTFGRALRP